MFWSILAGGGITLAVALIFHLLAAKELRRVATDIATRTELLKTETERLQKATEGIVMALEVPGEMEAVYEDGWFKGWRITQHIYTETTPVDEQGRLIRSPKLFQLKLKIRRQWRRILDFLSSIGR